MSDPKEIFKDLIIEGFEVFNGFYRIGNKGTLISNKRVFTREYCNGNITTNMTKEYTHIPRCSKKSPLLFSEIYAIVTDKQGTKTKLLRTVYIHKLVAEHFIEKPKKFKDRNMVAHKDHTQPQNNDYTNLMWADKSFFSTRNMVVYPHNRDNLKKANTKSGYYDKLKSGEFKIREHIIKDK